MKSFANYIKLVQNSWPSNFQVLGSQMWAIRPVMLLIIESKVLSMVDKYFTIEVHFYPGMHFCILDFECSPPHPCMCVCVCVENCGMQYCYCYSS